MSVGVLLCPPKEVVTGQKNEIQASEALEVVLGNEIEKPICIFSAVKNSQWNKRGVVMSSFIQTLIFQIAAPRFFLIISSSTMRFPF